MTQSTLEERARTELDAQQRADAAELERLASLATFDGESANVEPPPESLGTKLRKLMTPWTDEELLEAQKPNPHAFQDGHCGLFPVGEVSIIAAAGREGKTTVKVGVATALIIGHSLGQLYPTLGKSVIVYSAEDDRQQYGSKVAAQMSLLGNEHRQWVRERLLVPNLDDLGPMVSRSLVALLEGRPCDSGVANAIIEAIEPMMDGENPPGLLIFETASTLSDAEETNPGFRVLIMALKHVARALGVAVVLSHHVSQASLTGLSDLNISSADIRGGTVLVNNARQTAMLVNLGSDADPFPEKDARTVLRKMAAPGSSERITALITLDTSKGLPVPPVFFRWVQSASGHPAAVEVEPPMQLQRKTWRKVREMVQAERASARQEARSAKQDANVSEVVSLVHRLHAAGKAPTVRAVSIEAGHGAGWAAPYLADAVRQEFIAVAEEEIPRVKGRVPVYRPVSGHVDE